MPSTSHNHEPDNANFHPQHNASNNVGGRAQPPIEINTPRNLILRVAKGIENSVMDIF